MAQINKDFATIGQQFVGHFYNTFDTNRAELKALYTAESMLTFEGDAFQGVDAIMAKLGGLAFKKVRHVLTKCDFQPNPFNNGVIIFVTGDLKVDDEENALKFAQIFHLVPHQGSFVIVNDMFRLNIG